MEIRVVLRVVRLYEVKSSWIIFSQGQTTHGITVHGKHLIFTSKVKTSLQSIGHAIYYSILTCIRQACHKILVPPHSRPNRSLKIKKSVLWQVLYVKILGFAGGYECLICPTASVWIVHFKGLEGHKNVLQIKPPRTIMIRKSHFLTKVRVFASECERLIRPASSVYGQVDLNDQKDKNRCPFH